MNVPSNIRKTALVAAVTLAISGITTLDNDFNLQVGFSSVISSAYAGDGSSGGHKGAMGENKGGQGQRGQGGQGHKGGKSVAEVLADEGEDDSDRPAWAGQPGNEGKPGGGNAGDNTKKGGDYGDIVVMLRDDTGELIVEGNTTYAVANDGTLIPIINGEFVFPEGYSAENLLPVEFGRMNVARSPASVIEHSLAEALSKLDGGVLYDTVTLDAAGRFVVDGATIDSPLESLALYQALLTTEAVDGVITLSVTTNKDGVDTTYTFSVPEEDRLDLAASALAASSDKTGDLTIDEIIGISSFMGVDDELAALVSYDGDDEDTLPDWSYDPNATYPDDLKVYILIETSPGIFEKTLVEVNDYVTFTPVDDSSIQDNLAGGIDDFADAANDAVQVLEFVHDNAVE